MSSIYQGLGWLPQCPQNFRQQCKDLLNLSSGHADALQMLASHCLDESNLTALGRCIVALRAGNKDLSLLTRVKLGIVSNANIDLFTLPLIGCAARYGINLEVVESSLGQFLQQALDPNSDINRTKPDIVLSALDYRAFSLLSDEDESSPEVRVDKAVAQLLQVAEGFHRNCDAMVISSTLALPPGTLFGNFDRQQEGTLRWAIIEINRRLVAQVAKSDVILDVASLAEFVGTNNWFDSRQWNHGKLPFSLTFLPLYTDYVCRLLSAIRGKARKCLVVDLDNTIWGGVIGDDGVEGIVLGNGSAEGEAFLDFQRLILALRDRGVILAVCSKNDEDVSRAAFRLHPEMLLKEGHFSVFRSNWEDKPSNIRHIARELNIGLDALVFFDDNPFERELVRKELPQVAVIEVPKDPSLYRNALSQSGWFESIAYSAEDRQRNDQYIANSKRESLRNETDLETYLHSLSMVLHVAPCDSINRLRIAQLINKTNQFNLTTRRYTELQVEAFETCPSCLIAGYRLVDSYGDNGIIAVVICKEATSETWEIDTWLMSCRVLNRRVEYATLNHIVACAQAKGIRQIIGVYLPSGRNTMVADHYKNLGFRPGDESAANKWILDMTTYVPHTVPISIVSTAVFKGHSPNLAISSEENMC